MSILGHMIVRYSEYRSRKQGPLYNGGLTGCTDPPHNDVHRWPKIKNQLVSQKWACAANSRQFIARIVEVADTNKTHSVVAVVMGMYFSPLF